MIQDLKFGLRLLSKEKAFAAAALLTLSLCIGVNTSIFSVLHAVVLEPLAFPESGRVVTMFNIYPGVGVTDRGANSVPDYLDRRELTDVFESVALYGEDGYDVGTEGSPARIDGHSVTPSYFQVLRVAPLLGRAFSEAEGAPGGEQVAVLSQGLWKDLYAQDPQILGKEIRLSGIPYRIVGVMGQDFSGILGRDIRVWVPFIVTPELASDERRHSNNWSIIARLQGNVTPALAQQRIDALNRHNLDRFPKYRRLLEDAGFATRVLGLKEELIRQVRPTLYLLQGAVLFVLIIGCVNLANLMLVRSQVRLKELAVRFSLGAGRRRLARQLLVESVTIAGLGGLLGSAVAAVGVRLLERLGTGDLPRGHEVGIDGTVLAFSLAVSLLTGLAFGSIPIVQLAGRDLSEVFRQSERTGTAGRRALWARSALVVGQISIAFILLIGAGLLTLSFARLSAVDPGFQPEKVLTGRLSLPAARYGEDAATRNFLGSLLEELRVLPGVSSLGLTSYLPFSGSDNASVISIEGRPLAPGQQPPVPAWNQVDGGYFPSMGIPLLQGRLFDRRDSAQAAGVVIIDEYLARRHWPQGNPLGARIRRGLEPEDPLYTIIGVVGSVKTGDLAEQNPVGQLYFPYLQLVPRSIHLVVKMERDDALLTEAIRQRILRADPELPLFDVESMPERISGSLGVRRAAMFLCLAFGSLALALAAVGIYGVLAYTVAQRTREFGIRMALGARLADVLGMVLRHGMTLSALGLALGLAGALLISRAMTTLLFGVEATDPLLYLAVAAGLAAVTCLASLLPSLRAASVRPSEALRSE